MTAAAWLLAAPAVWGTYTRGAHLLALRSVWRGRRTERAAALTFAHGPDAVHTPEIPAVLAR